MAEQTAVDEKPAMNADTQAGARKMAKSIATDLAGYAKRGVRADTAVALTLGLLTQNFIEKIGELREHTSTLYARIIALESKIKTLEARPEVSYKGVWSEGTVYPEGSVVTFQGGAWIAKRMTSAKPGGIGNGFRLIVKSGHA